MKSRPPSQRLRLRSGWESTRRVPAAGECDAGFSCEVIGLLESNGKTTTGPRIDVHTNTDFLIEFVAGHFPLYRRIRSGSGSEQVPYCG